jgi:hypothetical protein
VPEYIVRAALRDEPNDGWVWICGPAAAELRSRMVVKIRPVRCWRAVYTEVRVIDCNFLHDYNEDSKKRRIDIHPAKDTIVIAEWYRNGLGIRTSGRDDTPKIELSIKRARLWGLKSLRAACHHPDPVVRLGTRLGVLGVWLGLVALAEPLIMNACAVIVMSVVLGIPGVWACWGRPRPELR